MRHIPIQENLSATLPTNDFSDPDVEILLGQLLDLSTRISSALRQPENVDKPKLCRLVTNILRFRKQRSKFFDADLFGEPAWDILLELYVAGGSGRKLSVSGACYVSGVPLTTALRWISRLEKDGWIYRVNDPLDKRRSWLMLSEESDKKLCGLLSLMAFA